MRVMDINDRTTKEDSCSRGASEDSSASHIQRTHRAKKSYVTHATINNEDLLSNVTMRKLSWYGRTRSNGLSPKPFLKVLCTERRRGRQNKRWTDKINDWTGRSFVEMQALAENREEWRTVVRRSITQGLYNTWQVMGSVSSW